MSPVLIGYARVSTQDQSLDLQIDALKGSGCRSVYSDKASGAKSHKRRPGLSRAISRARKGDTLVVWKLDRLGRSVSELIKITALLNRREINLRVISGGIDTSTPAGKFYFHIMAAFAEVERDLGIERTRAGLEAARRRGRTLGRPKVMVGRVRATAISMLDRGHSVSEVAEAVGVHASTVYRFCSERRAVKGI